MELWPGGDEPPIKVTTKPVRKVLAMEQPWRCALCGSTPPTLRQLDAPLSLAYGNVRRLLPKDSLMCLRHIQEFRGTPGRYVTQRKERSV